MINIQPAITNYNNNRSIMFNGRRSVSTVKPIMEDLIEKYPEEINKALAKAKHDGYSCFGVCERDADAAGKKSFLEFCDRIMEVRLKDRENGSSKIYNLYFRDILSPAPDWERRIAVLKKYMLFFEK